MSNDFTGSDEATQKNYSPVQYWREDYPHPLTQGQLDFISKKLDIRFDAGSESDGARVIGYRVINDGRTFMDSATPLLLVSHREDCEGLVFELSAPTGKETYQEFTELRQQVRNVLEEVHQRDIDNKQKVESMLALRTSPVGAIVY